MKPRITIIALLLCTVSLNSFAQKYIGGDISMLTKYEDSGATYYDNSGNTITSPLTFFSEQGMNTMRVRLFVNPNKTTTDPNNSGKTITDENVCQDIELVKALGKRIKDAGLKLMLDFHYSDTWADPAKQWTPAGWANLSDADIYTKIYVYTKDVLTDLVAAGATPDFIQTGNEISYGMLWGTPTTSSSALKKCFISSTSNWNYLTTLLTNATKACREVCPNAKIIIHTERTAQPDVLTGFYDQINSAKVDYDIIGLSYYPYFHGALNILETALTSLENKYSKNIMIVETGYPYAWTVPGTTYDYSGTYAYSDAGQKAFTDDLITLLNKHSKVNGLFWWWMEYNAKGTSLSGWYNAPLFDSRTGRATPALSELKNFLSPTDVSTIHTSTETKDDSWYQISGSKVSKPKHPGVYINNGKKVLIK